MTRDEALTFLMKHQPMPADASLSQDLIDSYDEIRKHFEESPDSNAIELFLRSFGDWNGLGVYQLVENVFYNCPRVDVVAALKKVLEDDCIPESVRYWSTQIAAAFGDEDLRKGLNISLKSRSIDIREAAELAIEMLDTNKTDHYQEQT